MYFQPTCGFAAGPSTQRVWRIGCSPPSIPVVSTLTTRCCVHLTSYVREPLVPGRSYSHELVRPGTRSTTIAVVIDLVEMLRLLPIEPDAILTQCRMSPQKRCHV